MTIILNRNIKLFICVLHGLLLFIVLWCITNSNYTSAADEALLGKINFIRQNFYGNRLLYEKNFVFINVSKDQKLITDPFDYGDIAVTDRNKLAQFFKILADNNNRHYFTLCDIFFEAPDNDDTALAIQINRCTKVLFPYHIVAGKVQHPCMDIPVALSDFVTYTGNFSKFRLAYNDSLKTSPLVMLNTLDRKEYREGFPNFNSILPQYYIQAPELVKTKKYPYYNLGELLALSQLDSFYTEFLDDRFIVIGNFDTDVHYSPAGKIAGPLILLNTYLTLKQGGKVSWWWVIFMVAGLSAVSYLLFFKKITPPAIKKYAWADLLMHLFVNKYISFSGICLLLIICSAFIFEVQPNMSPILLYLLAINYIMDFYKKHYKKEL